MEFDDRLNVLFQALEASGLGSQSILQTLGDLKREEWKATLSDNDPVTAAIVLSVMNESNEDVGDIICELDYIKSTLHKVIYKIKP